MPMRRRRWRAPRPRAFEEEQARLTLQHAQQRAIDRLTALQTVVTGTAQATTAAEVAEILVDVGRHILGADSALVYHVDGRVLHLLASFGYNEQRLLDFQRVPVDARPPVFDVVTTGRHFALSSHPEVLAWYPGVADPAKVRDAAVLTVPMRASDKVVGALFLAWHDERVAADDDIELAQAIADAGAVSLRRALLHDTVAERTALLRDIAHGVDDVVFAKDAEGRHLFVNEPGAALLTGGGGVEDVVGRSDAELLSEGAAEVVRAHDQEIMRSGTSGVFEEAIDLPGVGERRFTVRKGPLRDHHGRVVGVVGIARDITERALLERALRMAELRLRALENSPVLGVVAGTGDQILEANNAFLGMLRIDRSALEHGLTWHDFSLPEWREADRAAHRIALETGAPPVYEKEYARPDGSRVPVLIASVLLDGDPQSWIAVVTDLTAQRAAEAELRQSEQRYRSLVEATTSIVWVVGADGRVVEPQPTWSAFTGQQWPDHGGTRWTYAIHPEDRPRIFEEWQAASRAREVYETTGRLWHAPSGEYRHMTARAVPLLDEDTIREWICTLTDAHERTITRMRAIADAQLRAAVIESLQDGLVVSGEKGKVIEANAAMERLTGLSRDEILGAMPPYPWTPDPETQPDAWARYEHLRLNGLTGAGGDWELELHRRDGTLFPVIASVTAVRGDDGQVEMVVSTIKDITERKAAEDALRAERDYREAIVAALQEGMYVIALDGAIREVNAGWCEITGFTREEAVGLRPPFPWWPEGERERSLLTREFQRALAGATNEFESTIVTAEGEVRRVITNRRPLRDPDTGALIGFVGTFHDITRRAAAEERLRGLAKLTARLASANDLEDVGRATLAEILPRLDAQFGALLAVDRERSALHSVAAFGLPDDARERWQHAPFDLPAPAVDAAKSGEIVVIADQESFAARYPAFIEGVREVGIHTSIELPLLKGDDVVGVLFIGYDEERLLTAADHELLHTSAPIIAQALDRARLFELQRSVASTLQHAMLASAPVAPPELAVAARYVPAVAELEVGGDWYDVSTLDGQRVAVAVGDIVGRGVNAAAVMGQLRSALSALAHTTDSTTEAVSRLDRFARRIDGAKATTLLYAIVDPNAGTLRYTAAGHPPPLVIEASGEARFADDVHGWPLGVADPTRLRPEGHMLLSPGATIVFFTDGLVERRGEHLEAGLERLARAAAARVELPVDQLCDALVEVLVGDERRDDVALVALRLVADEAPAFTCRVPADPRELYNVRRLLRHWMTRQELPSALQADIVLAVGEACTNAIEHAYSDTNRATVLVEALRTRDDLVVTVRDDGSWRPLARDPRRNRGLRLIADVMDDLSVSSPPMGGTRVEMRRKLDHDGR